MAPLGSCMPGCVRSCIVVVLVCRRTLLYDVFRVKDRLEQERATHTRILYHLTFIPN